FAHVRIVEHFSNLIECGGVNTTAEEGRKREESVQVSYAEEIILISSHLVLAVSKQPGRPPEEVLRNASAVVADGRPTLSFQEDRRRPGHGFEKLGSRFQIRKRGGRSRARIYPVEGQIAVITLAWDDGIVPVIGDVMKSRSAGLSADR